MEVALDVMQGFTSYLERLRVVKDCVGWRVGSTRCAP